MVLAGPMFLISSTRSARLFYLQNKEPILRLALGGMCAYMGLIVLSKSYESRKLVDQVEILARKHQILLAMLQDKEWIHNTAGAVVVAATRPSSSSSLSSSSTRGNAAGAFSPKEESMNHEAAETKLKEEIVFLLRAAKHISSTTTEEDDEVEEKEEEVVKASGATVKTRNWSTWMKGKKLPELTLPHTELLQEARAKVEAINGTVGTAVNVNSSKMTQKEGPSYPGTTTQTVSPVECGGESLAGKITRNGDVGDVESNRKTKGTLPRKLI